MTGDALLAFPPAPAPPPSGRDIRDDVPDNDVDDDNAIEVEINERIIDAGPCDSSATVVTGSDDHGELALNLASAPNKGFDALKLSAMDDSPRRNRTSQDFPTDEEPANGIRDVKLGDKIPFVRLVKERSWNKLRWGKKCTKPEKRVRSASVPPSPKADTSAARADMQDSVAVEQIKNIPDHTCLNLAVLGVKQKDTCTPPQKPLKLRRQLSWNSNEMSSKKHSLIVQQPSDDPQSLLPRLTRTRSLNRSPRIFKSNPPKIPTKPVGSMKPPLIPKSVVATRTDKIFSKQIGTEMKNKVPLPEREDQDNAVVGDTANQTKKVVAKTNGLPELTLIPNSSPVPCSDDSSSSSSIIYDAIEVESSIETFEGKDQDNVAVTPAAHQEQELVTTTIDIIESTFIPQLLRVSHIAVEVDSRLDQGHNIVTVTENADGDVNTLEVTECGPPTNDGVPENTGRMKLPFLDEIVEKKKALDSELDRERQQKLEDLEKARNAEKAKEAEIDASEKSKVRVTDMVKLIEESKLVKHIEAKIRVKEEHHDSDNTTIEEEKSELPTDIVVVPVSDDPEDCDSSDIVPELRQADSGSCDSSPNSSWASTDSTAESALLGTVSFDSSAFDSSVGSFPSFQAHQQIYDLSNALSFSWYDRRIPDARKPENDNPSNDFVRNDTTKSHINALKKIQHKTRDAMDSSPKALPDIVDPRQRPAAEIAPGTLESYPNQDATKNLDRLHREDFSDRVFYYISSIFDFFTCNATRGGALDTVQAEKMQLLVLKN